MVGGGEGTMEVEGAKGGDGNDREGAVAVEED